MPPRPRFLTRLLGVALTSLALLLTGLSPAQASNVVTPGSFTGYGFDQCTAPTQESMDAWLTGSPYWAVGIYISGDSRGCREAAQPQPGLGGHPAGQRLAAAADHPGPAGVVHHPRPLPASRCGSTRTRPTPTPRPARRAAPRPPRPSRSRRATASPPAARSGTTSRPSTSPATAAASRRSASCPRGPRSCTTSATCPGSTPAGRPGITMLDNARVNRPGVFAMPDQLWIADWNGRADVTSAYVRSDGWLPHRRVHQYRGGHDETHGGVTINIDNNFLDLGAGSVARSAPGALRRREHRLPRLLPAPSGRDRRPGQGAAVPADRAEALDRRHRRCLLRAARRRWSSSTASTTG